MKKITNTQRIVESFDDYDEINISRKIRGYSPALLLIGDPEDLKEIKSTVSQKLESFNPIISVTGNYLVIECELNSDIKKMAEKLNL